MTKLLTGAMPMDSVEQYVDLVLSAQQATTDAGRTYAEDQAMYLWNLMTKDQRAKAKERLSEN